MSDVLPFLAGLVVASFGLFLLGLAGALVVRPARAGAFLSAFGQSLRAHVAEQVVRIAVGASLVVLASVTGHPTLFASLGWVLIGTSAALLAMPWRWHQRFASRVVPVALRYPWLLASGAAAMGGAVLWGLASAVGG